MSKQIILPLFIFLLFLLTPHTQAASEECIIPEFGPWPSCATGQAVSESDYLNFVEGITITKSSNNTVTATIYGEYHNSCIGFVSFIAYRSGNTYTIVESPTTPHILAPCLQVITSFQKSVPIDTAGLSAGEYFVQAGRATASFSLDETEISECIIPESGLWPSCATGGIVPVPPPIDPTCVIPEFGPWPSCATGGVTSSPTPDDPNCVIPSSGPWPECAR